MEAGIVTAITQKPASLLGLPPELRIQIYDLIYEPCFEPQQQFNPFFCTADLKYCPRRGKPSRLHQVCRQIRHECLPIYLERTTFVFDLAVLDSNTAEPVLVSWVRASAEHGAVKRNIIINLRAVRKKAPMFTIFISNTISGQRLSFKESDFSADCNLLARGMQEVKTLSDQKLTCRHKRCELYVDEMNELKRTLRRIDSEKSSQHSGLAVEDFVNIAKSSRYFLLQIPARWTGHDLEAADKQEEVAPKYKKLVTSMRETVQDVRHEIKSSRFSRRSRNR